MDVISKKEILNKKIFDGRIILSCDVDSCVLHNLTHKDTEILGAFCDFTDIHGEELKDILLEGYLNKDLNEL